MSTPLAQSPITAEVVFVPLNGGSVDEQISASLRSLVAVVASPLLNVSVSVRADEHGAPPASPIPAAVVVHLAPPLHQHMNIFRGFSSKLGAPLIAVLDADDLGLADSAVECGFMMAIRADELSDPESPSSQQVVSAIRASTQRAPIMSEIGSHLKALRVEKGISREDFCRSLWKEGGFFMSVNELAEIEDTPSGISNPSWIQVSEAMQLLGRWVSWQYGKVGEMPQATDSRMCSCEPCQEQSRNRERARRQREYFAEKNKTRRFSYED